MTAWVATATVTVSGSVLTIGTVSSGTVAINTWVVGPSVPPGTYIASNIAGSGNSSTWTLANSLGLPFIAVSSESMNGFPDPGGTPAPIKSQGSLGNNPSTTGSKLPESYGHLGGGMVSVSAVPLLSSGIPVKPLPGAGGGTQSGGTVAYPG